MRAHTYYMLLVTMTRTMNAQSNTYTSVCEVYGFSFTYVESCMYIQGEGRKGYFNCEVRQGGEEVDIHVDVLLPLQPW